ncbi:MAG: acyltransferase [Mediterranea sp.]|jgi:predicted LPLAT superfamily acyltransferase|nr:acyltransferase [Mediterranea sp.]
MPTWKGQTRGGTFGYFFFILLIKYLGIPVAYCFLRLVVLYFIPFAPKATRSTWLYARHILKRSRRRSVALLLLNYYRLGQVLIDKVAITGGQAARYKFEFEAYPEFLQLLNAGQGAILIGAHVGNWEVGAPFFDEYGKKIHIVMYDAEHRRIKEMLAKNGQGGAYHVIPINDDGLTHVFRIAEALERKEYVCFQGDRYLPGERTLRTPFLGQEALFPAGPFLVATRMKVPVVFYFAMREPGRTYRFHFIVAKPVRRTPGEKVEATLLKQYTTVLEGILRRYPEQWFNYYPFWEPASALPTDNVKTERRK